MGYGIDQEKRGFRQGDLVIIPSVFTDRAGIKTRPGIILSNLKDKSLQDCIVVPISTKKRSYEQIFRLYPDDLEFGELIYESDVRVDKILSVDRKLIRYKVGKVKRYVVDRIKKVLGELIK
jgi:mRNA-degrading endonuclease toxin of MazEF toxin-antitoxin module|tara:strand:- start:13 stop:375 length:363 start_codon:yes stop_codon:yes gene_type:complete